MYLLAVPSMPSELQLWYSLIQNDEEVDYDEDEVEIIQVG